MLQSLGGLNRYLSPFGCAKKLKKKQKYKEKLYQEVEKVAGKVRGFYDKILIEEISEEDFTKMMFIDGCLVVLFIHCVTSKYDDLNMSDQEVADVKRDLLLLENQLSYPVLDLLMNLRLTEEEKKNRIDEFLQIRKPHDMFLLAAVVFALGPAHLLELLHSKFIPEETKESGDSGHRGHYFYYSVKDLKKEGIHFRPSKLMH
ncbi:hypothetical protein POTOM_052436 [Populus tomentosa]|uniref:Uncharacterized protein n=1 Tax=Populus tomentosa TaxID=118781 RepID=A0A8X8C795_POPTO|nr:hypothetical protein POTOM_052436 [Populus tomentosa]